MEQDEVVESGVDSPVEDVVEQEAAPAPEEPTEQRQPVTFSPEQQEVVNRIVSSRLEADRARRAPEVKEEPSSTERPSLPDMPDPYDEDFEQQMKARDDAILKQALWDAEQATLQRAEQERQQVAAQQAQEQFTQRVTKYSERARSLGMTNEELQVAGSVVSAYGLPESAAEIILDDDKGPLITKYLAANPSEIEAMRTMSPYAAVVHVATQLKNKAVEHSGAQTPPPPADIPSGGAAPREEGPAGATYV